MRPNDRFGINPRYWAERDKSRPYAYWIVCFPEIPGRDKSHLYAGAAWLIYNRLIIKCVQTGCFLLSDYFSISTTA